MRPENKIFSMRLKYARMRRGIKVVDLSEQTSISGPLISKYENGHTSPSAVNLRKLCIKLGVSSDYLIGLSENEMLKANETINSLILYNNLNKWEKKVIDQVMKSVINHRKSRS